MNATTTLKPTKNLCAQYLVISNYVLLLLMMIVTTLPGVLPVGSSPMVILPIKLMPLLILLPGLLKDHLRTYIWMCFIVLFYFTQSVVETFLSSGAVIDYFITALTVIIFLSAMFYIKWESSLGRNL